MQDSDRANYLAAHSVLHHALNGRRPAARWQVDPHGKPHLGVIGPAFNLSRRSPWAAFVIGHDATALGLDLEVLHTVEDPLALAQDHFTLHELDELHATPVDARCRVFLQGWTRKEAVMKAVGLGLWLPARSFHVGLAPKPVTVEVAHASQAWTVDVDSLPDEGPTVIAVARALPA